MSADSTELSAEHKRHALKVHSERLAAHCASPRPGAPVPTCPEWTATDLVAHVGQTQRWITEIVERRVDDPARLPNEMAVPPTDSGAWSAWLSEGGLRAAEAFSDEALAAAVFNAAGDSRTGAEFWLSSLLNETVVHGADLAYATGSVHDIEPDIAAHLITNHFAMLTSPTWAALRAESADALRGNGQTLLWRADDNRDALEWIIERTPSGPTLRTDGEPTVTIEGPASTLLLVLTRRTQLSDATDQLHTKGDGALVQHWLSNTAHVAD